MSKKLPLYEMRIDPKKGSFVSAISIVEKPAIQSAFLAFSKQEQQTAKFAMDSERMELFGAAMIPDLAMYRKTEELGEYMSVFSAETIREIAQVYAERGFFNNMNIDHSDREAGSYVFQSYIVDEDKGVFAPKGIDVPNGSWIVGVKVNDEKVWNEIKEGKTTGFSVEGLFDILDTEIDLELAQNFEALLNEHFAEPKGCLMFFPDINIEQWKLGCIAKVPNALEKELEPHVTILYGFNDFPELVDSLKAFIREALNVSPLMLELGRISKFIQPDGDVVKIDIMDCSGTLRALNTILSDTYQIISQYGEYKPHMTIAYTEPRPDQNYSSDIPWPWEFGLNYLNKGKIVYSDANGLKTDILIIK